MSHFICMRSVRTIAALLAISITGRSAILAARTQVPFNAHFSAELTTSIQCPSGSSPTLICFEGNGSGNATLLGLTQIHFSGSFDAAQFDPTTGCVADVSQITLTGASGNMLFFQGQGTFCPATLSESGTQQINGGTGLFNNATGETTYSVSFNDTFTADNSTFVGTVSSPGSLKEKR